MTSKSSDSLPYDAAAALAYINNLSPNPPSLAIADLEGAVLQPTIGSEAAALLDILVRAHRPGRILEIGTSLGYAACMLGRAAASYGGRVLTLEHNLPLADAARANVASQSLGKIVEVITADAREWVQSERESFGLILQDGGKEDYLPMLERLVEVLEPGGLLVSDDVLFPVMNLPPRVKQWGDAVDAYNRALKDHPHLRTAWLPIGDGIAISVKV